jgi:hypothetical protein
MRWVKMRNAHPEPAHQTATGEDAGASTGSVN